MHLDLGLRACAVLEIYKFVRRYWFSVCNAHMLDGTIYGTPMTTYVFSMALSSDIKPSLSF